MDELRKVTVTMSYQKQEIVGLFHRWFEKKFDDNTSMLYAVIEDDKGKITLFDTDTCQFTFHQESNFSIAEQYAKNP